MRNTLRTCVIALALTAVFSSTALQAQAPPARAPSEYTHEQQEALHVGMLELRQLELSGTRSAAIAKGV